MFDNLFNKKMMIMLPAALTVLMVGCQEEANSAPAPEVVDLTTTEDLFAQPVQANPLTSDPTAVLVRVNGVDITRGEVLEMMNVAMKQMAGRVSPQQMPQVQSQMYEQIKSDLITKTLIDAAVAQANIVISDEEVTEAIAQIQANIPQGQSLEAALAAQGTTMEELKENIKTDMATRKFLEEKTVGIKDATVEEAQEFYDTHPDNFIKKESVTASHILIKTDGATNDVQKAELKAHLEEIRDNIIAGTITFEDAAKADSNCPSSVQGGSLGTFGKGQMVPEFEVAAFTQEVGEVGDIIETQFGYHIILVTDRTEEGTVSFDEAKDQIIAYLTGQKKQEAVEAYIKGLRDSATIEEIAN
jgi:peptidyl-prolyl cis-trans isomerase C